MAYQLFLKVISEPKSRFMTLNVREKKPLSPKAGKNKISGKVQKWTNQVKEEKITKTGNTGVKVNVTGGRCGGKQR